MSRLTLANCRSTDLKPENFGMHPTVTRHELIRIAGALNNTKLLKELGSQEGANFYDGMLGAGLISENPYWPRHAKGLKK